MIYLIDAICGSGKSTYIIKKMRDNPDKKWLYITPFLDEVYTRLPNQAPELNFFTPNIKEGGTKLESIKKLIEEGRNIASTHALFKIFDKDVVDLILEKGYVLVIDESVEAISEYRGENIVEGLKPSDIHALLEGGFVIPNPEKRDRLDWNDDRYPEHDGRYQCVKKMCDNQMLYLFNKRFLICEYPPELLANIEYCFVLTYMFKACSMRYWMDINNIQYKYVGLKGIGLRAEEDVLKDIRSNLEIISNRKLDKLQRLQRMTAFSKRWMTNIEPPRLDEYRAIIRSNVVKHKVNSSNIFWTTYKEHRTRLEGQGYTNCFLSLNLRSTNNYKDKDFCVYAANLHDNLTGLNYIKSLGVEITQEEKDIFCLSNLIQFMFRGSIRDGKPMKILILSKRVRMLLEQWLNSKEEV